MKNIVVTLVFLFVTFLGFSQEFDKMNKVDVKQKGKDVNASEYKTANKTLFKTVMMRKASSAKKPLYFIGGVEVGNKRLKRINPEEISFIKVLKEKEALKKYGKKGKNGVVEIFLK